MRIKDVLDGPARRNGQHIDALLTIFNALLYYGPDDIELNREDQDGAP